jgi:glyceraldehyde-3-phosphate dehydrogenase type I
MVRVAINGFGRIGRTVFKIGFEDKDIEFVAINDLVPVDNLAYLLKYDSVYGTYNKEVKVGKDSLIVDGKEIKVFCEKDPEKLPWKELNIDVVIESTGIFTHVEDARKHLKAGAKKVFVSAPTKGGGKFIVKGVNEHTYDKEKDDIITIGSCTTNCVAPVVKVLNDNFKIKRGFLTTVHAYTATQGLVDKPNKKDFRRGRAAALNIVPTTTGAAKSVVEVIPELKGKFDGIALRVPVLCGSISDIVCIVEKETSVEEVNELFKNVSQYHLKGVLQYSEEPLVSTDIIGNPHSCIVDGSMTRVIGNLIKVLAWYDNEWGFSARMVDVLKMLI